MNIVEDIIGEIIFKFLWRAIKLIGALVRWPFMSEKFNVEEIYKQNWNGVIGLFFLGTIITLTVLLL
ncbi:hypothetical protein [Flavobacterium limnosediminis]|uniref:hypothetical protein n=1 Tax=Flavobacterium limnosediminis TaxID=1401027 RepID=UPI000557D760|nr:hypothetical protein [Flavobacterium limnosediminis]